MPLKYVLRAAALLFCSVTSPLMVSAQTLPTFSLLTYNVAGLPYGLSESHPRQNIPLMNPKIKPFDIAVFQEDFCCHLQLVDTRNHPYGSTPYSQTLFDLGDGLNQVARFQFYPAIYRETWKTCSGTLDHYSDCLTYKGFSTSKMTLGQGIEVVLINVHLDAGYELEDFIARLLQIDQLIAYLKRYHPEDPLILAGDWNVELDLAGSNDGFLFDRLTQGANLIDVCHELRCGIERPDRVLYRSSQHVQLQPTAWQIPAGFFDGNGEPLSDHEPVAVQFSYVRVS